MCLCADGVWAEGACECVREITGSGDWMEVSVKLTGCHSNIDGISLPLVTIETPSQVTTSSDTL